MTSTINASTTAGIVTTADTSGVLALQTAGTTAVTVDASQNVTLAGTLTTTGVTTVQAGTAALPAITTTGDTNTGIFFPAADTIAFSEGGAECARFDSAGNFGLGVTPSAWGGTKAFEVGSKGTALFNYSSTDSYFTQNAYFGSGWTYGSTAAASTYRQSAGAHYWNIAGSGTAGNAITFTQAMTLDASGNLLVGTTSGNGARVLTKASTSDNSTFGIFCQNSSAATLFGVRSDGLFFTGTATNAPYNFTVVGSALYVNSSGQIGVLSSVKKAKTNIVAAPTANWLNQLEVVNFNYRKKDVDGNYTDKAESKITWGVIADDAEKIAKDFCAYDSDGNLAGFHYDRLISPMLKAIQEQQALITQLQADVAALKGASA